MNIYIKFVLAFLIGYFVCCLHPAFFFGKFIKNVDIREHGSNNSGASNATVVLGIKYGALTALIDILKSTLAVFLTKYLLYDSSMAVYICALGCIIGHMYPFYLNFEGGKGLASLLGICLAINIYLCLILGFILIIVTLLTQYIAIGTMLVVTGFNIYTFIEYGVSKEFFISLTIFVLMLLKHRINLKRIKNGEEIKLFTALKKK